uniref:KRAB domain-containing protein n=1 Tax=Catharus ustulatus TaxID=91951 RepID=A0A8C3XZR0_CATUS
GDESSGLLGIPVLFEDVAVRFSPQEWASLDERQKEMYRSVMEGNYEMLVSLCYPGPKPDILHRLERGEEPWICPSPGDSHWKRTVEWSAKSRHGL